MSYQPNTTVYLCTGTGLDYYNSAWMHRYAYSNDSPDEARQWWNSLFQWFKAHSIAEGYWYYSYTDPSKGYIDIGRTPLSTGSKGQSGLGNAGKQAELDNNSIHYNEAIKAIDWVVFANGDGGSPFDVQYCFVDKVEYINHNTARIHFTVDAILTYQKYFWLGRCFVDRDMQYGEWESTSGTRDNQTPTLKTINTMPEAVGADPNDYILQKLDKDSANQDTLNNMQFGSYNRMFCSTDIDLSTIKASAGSAIMPSFEPSESTKVGDVELGIGVYQFKKRKNEYFKLLGSFNAMEHLISTYVLPNKVAKEPSGDIVFLDDASTVIEDKYKKGTPKILKLPVFFTDNNVINRDHAAGTFKPVNFKCYTAPITYISIADKQGSSLEITPQSIIPQDTPTNETYFSLWLDVNITAAPNMPSNLYIRNLRNRQGSEDNPFMTLWQIPSYAMTPNASGYNQVVADTIAKAGSDVVYALALGSIAIAASVFATPAAGIPLAGTTADAVIGAFGTAAAHGAVGAAGKGLLDVTSGMIQSKKLEQVGLPKAAGGLPNNMTSFTMNNAGYEFYWCHLKTDYMKLADYMFSITGYNQSAFRYPHVNTRKRWCYVKLSTVNIRNIGGDNYDIGGVPFWARTQIEQRLKAGVTFWNLRHAMGDSPIGSYSAMPDTALKMKFVKNYGTSVRSEQICDNADNQDGYASDYSDEAME